MQGKSQLRRVVAGVAHRPRRPSRFFRRSTTTQAVPQAAPRSFLCGPQRQPRSTARRWAPLRGWTAAAAVEEARAASTSAGRAPKACLRLRDGSRRFPNLSFPTDRPPLESRSTAATSHRSRCLLAFRSSVALLPPAPSVLAPPRQRPRQRWTTAAPRLADSRPSPRAARACQAPLPLQRDPTSQGHSGPRGPWATRALRLVGGSSSSTSSSKALCGPCPTWARRRSPSSGGSSRSSSSSSSSSSHSLRRSRRPLTRPRRAWA
mmetsp:Transcript_94367/g.253958  ORF Transcript_94367/g.253958 Transcript_94367/m.253958 type:complete len:263 (-) Transcript_94367:770-1558(-)